MKHLILKITVCLCIVSEVYSQALPADITFFNPTIGSATQTINPSAGTGDDSQTFTDAINAVNTAGGGKVIVNAGTYRILEIDLKSNVHVDVNSGATFLPFNASTTSNNALFSLDSNSGIDNLSIVGVGGNFTVDISSLAVSVRIRVINFRNCANFKVANFDIIDGQTEFSALAFGGNYITTGSGQDRRITSVRGIPNGGIIENISITNAHYGYGLIQTQAGKNLLFRNLSAIGGATLRLETGFNLLQFTDTYNFEEIKLDNIWARNLENTNGQSALQISPHTLDQGYFNAENITATSSEFAVVWAAGFLGQPEQDAGLTTGTFDNTSKIRNVTATFGQNAQMRDSRLRYIPCVLRVERANGVGIATTLSSDGESRIAPSPGAVLSEEDKPGYYALDFPDTEVTAIGYNIAAHYLPPNAFIKSSFDDYEVCDESVNGVNFFVPVAVRNTPNPRSPTEGGLSVEDFNLGEIKIFPIPANRFLHINLPENMPSEDVKLYNVHGKQVGQFQFKSSNQIDVSNLQNGVYFMVFKNGLKKKLIIN